MRDRSFRVGASVGGLLAAGFLCCAAHGQVFTWANAGGGNWGVTTNWSPIGLPDAVGKSALIDLSGTFTITISGSPAPDSVSILNAGTTVAILNNSRLITQGAAGVLNHGTITVNDGSGMNFTSLRFDASGPLSGSGALRLRSSANLDTAMIESTAPAVIQHGPTHRILGQGRIYAQFNNSGLVHADGPGAIEIAGIFTQTGAGELRADPGIISLNSGALLSGGSITGANGGRWQAVGSPQISGVTLHASAEVLNNSVLRLLDGGLVNNAVLHVNSGIGINFTRIHVEQSAAIFGTGSINLRAAANLDTAYIESASDNVLTNGAQHSITGAGRIYATTMNDGVLRATTPGKLLEIRGSFSQSPAGRIIADNADVGLGDNAVVSGGLLQSIGAGRVRVTGNARVSGPTNQGAMAVDNNALLRFLSGGLNNDGLLTVNATAGPNFTRIRIEENSAVAGLGSIDLNAAANLDTAYIEAADGVTLAQLAPHRIRGKGRIYTPMNNSGTIIADRAGEMLEIRSAITQSGGAFIRGEPGIAALGSGSNVQGGWFASGGGGSVRSSGQAKVGGVRNSGLLEVGNNTRIQVLESGLLNDGVLVVNHNAGLNFTSLYTEHASTLGGSGTLVLNASSNADTAYLDTAPGASFRNDTAHTITGNGRIYATMTNAGIIRGSATDAGDIVRIHGVVTQEGGRIIGDVGTVGLAGGTINGGTLESLAGPVRVIPAALGTLNGVTNTGEFSIDNNGHALVTALTNNGMIRVNSTAGFSLTSLRFAGIQEIAGTGTIILNPAPNFLDTAYLESTGDDAVATIGAGQTLIGSGRLYGKFLFLGQMSPGLLTDTVGRFEPRAAFTFESPSLLHLDVLNDVPGQYDAIAGNSVVALGGVLEVDVTSWNTLDLCASVDLITAASVLGVFDDVFLAAPEPPSGRAWRLDYQSTKVSLRLTCTADLSGDCLVDDRDFVVFVGAYNLLDCADPAMPRGCPSDMNADGLVDDADFVIWLAAYNELICT